ncbi:isochorismatase family protein [Candidatus Riflebacteria bacterium]
MNNNLKLIEKYNTRYRHPETAVCALLVIDMQQYFAGMARPILGNVRSLLTLFRSKKLPVFFTRHGHKEPAKDGGMLFDWWGELIQFGSKNWEIMETVKPENGEKIFNKNRYSAFMGTDLDEVLQEKGVEELIICGVLSNCCCETTARDAFMHDYRVFFPADATATANEELHLASLKNLAFAFAHVVSTEFLLESL